MVSAGTDSDLDAVSTYTSSTGGAHGFGPLASMSRDQLIVLEVGGDASGDAGDVGSTTMTLGGPLQTGIDTHGLETHTRTMSQERTEETFYGSLEAIPLRFPPGMGQLEATPDDDSLGHPDFYESTGINRDEQRLEASSSTDVLGEEAFPSHLIGARQAEGENTRGYFITANMADQEAPDETHEQTHEKHEAIAVASVPTVADETKKGDATDYDEVGEDTVTGTTPPPYHPPPANPTTISPAQATASEREQVELATKVSASDDYFEAESPPALAPHTPFSSRLRKAPSGSSARRQTRTRKDKSQVPNTTSPPTTRSSKRKKVAEAAEAAEAVEGAEVAEEAEAAATETDAPPRRKGPIKIILHFNRKSKANTDADVAPKPEAAEEGNTESTTACGEPSRRDGGSYDGAAEGPDADADADEEVVLL